MGDMKTLETTGEVDGQSRLFVPVPRDIAPGRYRVTVTIDPQPDARRQTSPENLPVLDVGPWPSGLSLKREDMYGDDGR